MFEGVLFTDLLTVRETADFLSVSVPRVHQLLRDKKLSGQKRGYQVYLSRAAVETFAATYTPHDYAPGSPRVAARDAASRPDRGRVMI